MMKRRSSQTSATTSCGEDERNGCMKGVHLGPVFLAAVRYGLFELFLFMLANEFKICQERQGLQEPSHCDHTVVSTRDYQKEFKLVDLN